MHSLKPHTFYIYVSTCSSTSKVVVQCYLFLYCILCNLVCVCYCIICMKKVNDTIKTLSVFCFTTMSYTSCQTYTDTVRVCSECTIGFIDRYTMDHVKNCPSADHASSGNILINKYTARVQWVYLWCHRHRNHTHKPVSVAAVNQLVSLTVV